MVWRSLAFDGHMLILARLGVGDVPTQVPLFHASFWVQVHDVPIGFMTESLGRILGNFIGEFVEYDPKNSSDFWKSYMRIRVLVDVRKPLRRGKKINVGGDNVKVVRFKYERLSVFYYLCGLLGHLDNSCDLHFELEHGDGSRGWGPELKVERRTPGENNAWLRKEGGPSTPAAPPVNPEAARAQAGRQRNNAEMDGNNYESYAEQFQFLNVTNDVSNHGSNRGLAVTLSTIDDASNPPGAVIVSNTGGTGSSTRRNLSRAPLRQMARDNVAIRATPAGMDVEEGDEEEVIKRKRTGLGVSALETQQQQIDGVHFLLAGPGSQACREQ